MKLAAVLLMVAPLFAQTTVLQCGRLLDVRAGTLVKNAVVVVKDGVVTEAGVGVKATEGAAVIDLRGSVCLPGLMDAHTHVMGEMSFGLIGRLTMADTRAVLVGARNARKTLQAGFTMIREMGSPNYTDVSLRDSIAAGETEGPRVLASGPAFGITGGHCDNNFFPPGVAVSAPMADGPWPARAQVRKNVKYGADLIKICASGGVLSKGTQVGTPQYSPDEMAAVVEEAHRQGRKVAAHAHGTQSIKEAIAAGVDSVEHASLIDDEGIRMAKEKGTWLVFDIYNTDYTLAQGAKNGLLPEMLEKEKMVGTVQRENFRKAVQAGAKIAFGTDAGVYPHGDNAKQFAVAVAWGLKPVEAIRSATLNTAELFGVAGKAGEIRAGAWADIIAVSGNPLEDIRALEAVKFVMKGGKVYRNELGAGVR